MMVTNCRKVRFEPIEWECQFGRQKVCKFKGVIRIDFQPGQSFGATNQAFILDLAEHWHPDLSNAPQATIRFNTSNGVVSQSFPLVFAPEITQTINPVSKDTIPYTFVFTDPAAVQSFLASASSLASEPEVTVQTDFSFTQVDCSIPSGKYVNYLRYKDETGVYYFDNFYINYIAPENIQAGCEQGQITITR